MSNQPFRVPKEGLAIKNPTGNTETRIVTGSTLPNPADYPLKTMFIHDSTGIIYNRKLDGVTPVWEAEEIASGVVKGVWNVTPTVTPESIQNTDTVDVSPDVTVVHNTEKTKATISVDLSNAPVGAPEAPVITVYHATFEDTLDTYDVTKRFSMKMLSNQENEGIYILSGYISTNANVDNMLENLIKYAANLPYTLNFGTSLHAVAIDGYLANKYNFISGIIQHHNTNAVVAMTMLSGNELEFQVGETVIGQNNNYQATVLYVIKDATYGIHYMEISAPSGTFEDGETLVGQTTTAEAVVVKTTPGYYAEAGQNTFSSVVLHTENNTYQAGDEFEAYIGYSPSPTVFGIDVATITGAKASTGNLEDMHIASQIGTMLQNNIEVRFFTAVIVIGIGQTLSPNPIEYEINFNGGRQSFDAENTTWGTVGSYFYPQSYSRQEYFNDVFPNITPVGTDYVERSLTQVSTFPVDAAVNEMYRVQVDAFNGEEYEVKPFKTFVKNKDIIQITNATGGSEAFHTLTNYNEKDNSIGQVASVLSTLDSNKKSSFVNLTGNIAENTSNTYVGYVRSTGSLRDNTGSMKFEFRKTVKTNEYVTFALAAVPDDYDVDGILNIDGTVSPDIGASLIQFIFALNAGTGVVIVGSVDDAGHFISNTKTEFDFDVIPALSEYWIQVGIDLDTGLLRIIYRNDNDTNTNQQILSNIGISSIKSIHPDDKWYAFFPILQGETVEVNFGATPFVLDEIVQNDKLYVQPDETFSGTFFKTNEKWNPRLGLPQEYKVVGACVEVTHTGSYRGRRFIRGSLAYWNGYNTVPFTYINDAIVLNERVPEIEIDAGAPNTSTLELNMDVDNVNHLNIISNCGSTLKHINITLDVGGVVPGDRLFIKINDSLFDGVVQLNGNAFYGIGGVIDNERNYLDELVTGLIRVGKVYEFIYQSPDSETDKFQLMNGDTTRYGIHAVTGNTTLNNKFLTSEMTLVEGTNDTILTIPVRGDTFFHKKGDVIKILNTTTGDNLYGGSQVQLEADVGVTIIYPLGDSNVKYAWISKPATLTCIGLNTWLLEGTETSG